MKRHTSRLIKKIANFESFPEEIKVVLDKYIDDFDTKLRKSMNVEPVQLNMREGTKPYACFSCRPTPAHYRETGRKLLQDLLDQHIIERCGDSRSKWCAPAHFVEKPGRVPLALRLEVDFTRLNERLLRDQLQVFPTVRRSDSSWVRLQGVGLHRHAPGIFPDKSQESGPPKNHFYAAFRKTFLPKNSYGKPPV